MGLVSSMCKKSVLQTELLGLRRGITSICHKACGQKWLEAVVLAVVTVCDCVGDTALNNPRIWETEESRFP